MVVPASEAPALTVAAAAEATEAGSEAAGSRICM